MPSSIFKHRLAAFNRQEGRCYYCGFPMWLPQSKDFAVKFKRIEGYSPSLQCTAEHLLPRQEGGTNSSDNIVAACRFCNMTRHRIPSQPDPTTYRNHVMSRIHAGKWHPRSVRHLVTCTTRTGNKAMK